MKKLLIVVVALLVAPLVRAQADTLSCYSTHRFEWHQPVVPAALAATGAVISSTSLHQTWDVKVHDFFYPADRGRFEVENVVQFLPHAAFMVLDWCGVESKHGFRDRCNLALGSFLIETALVQGLKYSIGVERPYGNVYNSFPSGHTATAFFGAELLRREYGERYPWVGVLGYATAAGVGVMRMYNNRHWCSDVLAGAGLGILSASAMYWLAPYLTF